MLNRYFEAGEYNVEFILTQLAVKNIDFALISLSYLLDRPKFDINVYSNQHTYCFFHIQSLLTACGNLSNVFNGHSAPFTRIKRDNKDCKPIVSAEMRSRDLRELFSIDKLHFPLIFQKEVRNTNEHFNDRVEAFYGEVGDYNILDNNTPQHFRDIVMNNPHLRTYDRTTGIYYTYNQRLKPISYNLHDLRNELIEMRETITANPLFKNGWTNDGQTIHGRAGERE